MVEQGAQHTMLVPVATRALPSPPHPLARARGGDHLSLWPECTMGGAGRARPMASFTAQERGASDQLRITYCGESQRGFPQGGLICISWRVQVGTQNVKQHEGRLSMRQGQTAHVAEKATELMDLFSSINALQTRVGERPPDPRMLSSVAPGATAPLPCPIIPSTISDWPNDCAARHRGARPWRDAHATFSVAACVCHP